MIPLLWSFQPLARVAELRATGELVGSWEHVPPSPGDELVQVCLPVLRAEWVREIRPLPRSAHEVAGWSARA